MYLNIFVYYTNIYSIVAIYICNDEVVVYYVTYINFKYNIK